MRGFRIAVGHQARVGKDEFGSYVVAKYGGGLILRFAEPLHPICKDIQKHLRRPQVKDGGLLQKIGTGLREYYDDNVFVDPVKYQINNCEINYPDHNLVIVDLRDTNEWDMVKAKGFTTVKITRTDRVIDRDPNHKSETALKDHPFDYVITNDGTLGELYQKIDEIMAKEGYRKMED